MGEVKTVLDVYNRGDIVINPAVVGTGLKIKSVEALGFGKILVTSCHSTGGLNREVNPFIAVDNPDEFANAIVNVMSNVGIYNDLRHRSYLYAKEYNQQTAESLRLLFTSETAQKPIDKPRITGKQQSALKCTIFAFPRTGSSTLRKLFDLHPRLSCIHEPFNRDLDHVKEHSDNLFGAEDIGSPERLKFVLDRMFAGNNVLKHLDVQLTRELNEALMQYPNNKLIFLWRRNLLQRLISNWISMQAQYWHGDRSVILKQSFEPIPVNKLRDMLRRDEAAVNRWRTFARECAAEYFELTYEELYDSTLSEEQKLRKLNELFDFIGVGALTQDSLVEKAKDLLKPEKSKLNSELTYQLIPNIRHIDELLGNEITGRIFPIDK